jgi:hypothetical protein
MISTKLAAQAFRALADRLDRGDSHDPESQVSAVVTLVVDGEDAELDAEAVAILEGLGLPADAIPPAIVPGSRPSDRERARINAWNDSPSTNS